jgi:hypothetical protein
MAQGCSIAAAQPIEMVTVLALMPASTPYQYSTGRATGWATGREEAASKARRCAFGIEAERRRRLRLRASTTARRRVARERQIKGDRRRLQISYDRDDLSKREAAMSPRRPESREETPKEGIRRQVAAAQTYAALQQKATGKSPDLWQ